MNLPTPMLIDVLEHDRLTTAQVVWLLDELVRRSNCDDDTATSYLEWMALEADTHGERKEH